MANDLNDPSNSSTHSQAWACPDFIRQEEVGLIYCNATHDSVSCWPPTKAGTLSVISCFPEMNNVKYDVTENASRFCFSNGTWSNSNYSNCRPLVHLDKWNVNQWTIIIYYIGFSVSLLALLIAITIFITFKVRLWGGQMKSMTCRHLSRDLRCLRNTLHINLMLTFVLGNLTWIMTSINANPLVNNQSATCVLFICFYYFQATNFFWMFVEGFYLYLLVVRTFQAEKVRFFVYVAIGWGVPVLVVGTWVIVKAELVVKVQDERVLLFGQTTTKCPWIEVPTYDFIYISPLFVVLAINFCFLVRIMWVLITKLRISTTTRDSEQYRHVCDFLPRFTTVRLSRVETILWKAAKALLVLIPLLGVTYILIITAPDPDQSLSAVIFAYIRAILLSTQGLTVSVLYCFLNGEVRSVIRTRWKRWRELRSADFSSRNRSSRSRFYCDNSSPINAEEENRLCDFNIVPSNKITSNCNGDSNCNTTSFIVTENSFVNKPQKKENISLNVIKEEDN